MVSPKAKRVVEHDSQYVDMWSVISALGNSLWTTATLSGVYDALAVISNTLYLQR